MYCERLELEKKTTKLTSLPYSSNLVQLKHVFFFNFHTPKVGNGIQFDGCIFFQMGWFNHQPRHGSSGNLVAPMSRKSSENGGSHFSRNDYGRKGHGETKKRKKKQ